MSSLRSDEEWIIRYSGEPVNYYTCFEGFEVKRQNIRVPFGLPDITKVCVDQNRQLYGMLGISFDIQLRFLHSGNLMELLKQKSKESYSAYDILLLLSDGLKKQAEETIFDNYPSRCYDDIREGFYSGNLSRQLGKALFYLLYRTGFLMDSDYFRITGTAHGAVF